MSNELYLGQPDEDTTNWIKKYATPFHFEALEDGNISLTKNKTPIYDINLLYSLDNKTYQNWDYTIGTNLKQGQKLYLKAKNENKTFSDFLNGDSYYSFTNTAKANVAGNIMSLLYNDFASKLTLPKLPDVIAGPFMNLFYDNGFIVDASNLILPATILTQQYCYCQMFYNCSSLVSAPKLPATKLTDYCYNNMFCNTMLSSLPELPATKLTDSCYYSMFSFYMSDIPVMPAAISFNLPATSFANECYNYMFVVSYAQISAIHYPKSVKNNPELTSMEDFPYFGAYDATIYFDL